MIEKRTAVARGPNSRMRDVRHPPVSFMKCAQWTASVSRGSAMKMSHRLQSDSAGPVWGLILGMFLMVAGVGIWIYVKASEPGDSLDESLAMAAMLVGAFLAAYAGREIRHGHR